MEPQVHELWPQYKSKKNTRTTTTPASKAFKSKEEVVESSSSGTESTASSTKSSPNASPKEPDSDTGINLTLYPVEKNKDQANSDQSDQNDAELQSLLEEAKIQEKESSSDISKQK